MKKFVYRFQEGDASMRELLGGKGANLAEMTGLGLPVPRGFTISTEACTEYYENDQVVSDVVLEQIEAALKKLEEETGKQFGSEHNPLLVSVRSGSRASMPGMMDTVLNLGLNDQVVEGLAELTGNSRFAYDSYRRFITMFSDVVMEVPKSKFDKEFDAVKERLGVEDDTDVSEEAMREVVQRFKNVYLEAKGTAFPEDPVSQLRSAVEAVFRSWNTERAIVYRRHNNIPSSWGTAVNVQEMVFGNSGETSGTGVAFSRNPSTGEKKLYGEFLINAQGEDVVAGIRTPEMIDHLQDRMPELYKQFADIAKTLETHYKDMQDMEFTIERGKLFMLQTRNGKRTAEAAVKIAVDLVQEGLLTKEEALLQIDPAQLDSLLHPTFTPEALQEARPIASGLPASPGAASGVAQFNYEDAKAAHERGESVILCRLETSPEDIQGMYVSKGILTARGGMTSHAAVVARGMGKCCVSGCSDVAIDADTKTMTTKDGLVIRAGDYVSLNGSTGQVYAGQLPTQEATISGNFDTIMHWADETRYMKVRANADSPNDAREALKMGAEGIGLCRTEHMFFDLERIFAFRLMILADNEANRRNYLNEILPYQQEDFEGIFRELNGMPVTIRLLDPPFHEFLPQEIEEIRELSNALGYSVDETRARIEKLHELNPMLGARGCRLLISYPEIAEMQTTAIVRAALKVQAEGVKVHPEIMIPLISELREIQMLRAVIAAKADELIAESGESLDYQIGTMMEIPRACLLADEIASEADFFSMGTNDLTQMVYGLSRDDAGPILDVYYDKQIFEADPTSTIDEKGVGQLVKAAVANGRSTKEKLKIGVCGEHGGDPVSVDFFHRTGLDYVSCSPYRVPIARLSAAQAQIRNAR
ncbi:MAG: pyruvate, phosphate dikinase [Fastidiosipilaceae bacterium]|jgi:pyruvate,orthophosphate dikinase